MTIRTALRRVGRQFAALARMKRHNARMMLQAAMMQTAERRGDHGLALAREALVVTGAGEAYRDALRSTIIILKRSRDEARGSAGGEA